VAGWSARRRKRLARTLLVSGLLTLTAAFATGGFGLSQLHLFGGAELRTAASRAHTSPATSRGPSPVASALFAAGSCVAFAPTGPDRHQTVFLDAGHGGPDPGGQGITQTGRVINERELTLPVVLDTTALLRADGYRVVVSRTANSSVVKLGPNDLSNGLFSLAGEHRDTAARPLCADFAHAVVLVSVHFNVGSNPNQAGTLTTYDAARSFARQNVELAKLLQTDMVSALRSQPGWRIPNDGVVTDTTVGNSLTSAGAAYGHILQLGPARTGYFTSPSLMPGALIEPIFLTDPFEGSIASSSHGQHVMAGAIARAILAYLAAARS
jgi:N-acetylmuramoyl-L-alanine amidase